MEDVLLFEWVFMPQDVQSENTRVCDQRHGTASV